MASLRDEARYVADVAKYAIETVTEPHTRVFIQTPDSVSIGKKEAKQ